MAVTVTWQDTTDAQRVVDALLTAAAVAAAEGNRARATWCEQQANALADAIRWRTA